MSWKADAHNALCGACASIDAKDFRRVVLLLDDATNLIAQGHLIERHTNPVSGRDGRAAPAPQYLRAMVSGGDPQTTKRMLRTLLYLHEIRNALVHQINTEIKVTRNECLKFLNEVISFAGFYDVTPPTLVPVDLEPFTPVNVLVEFTTDSSPARLPRELRSLAVNFCTQRGILAGLIENLGSPLVRCSICHRLVSLDQTDITQEDWMTEDDETLNPYCRYGCGSVHQRLMKEEFGYEATTLYSEEYYLQPTIEKLPGVLEGRWGDLRRLEDGPGIE